MLDNELQPNNSEKAACELRKKIQVLERSLQQELSTRSAIEFELYEIKNSLGWTLLGKCRSARNKLLAEGTLRLRFYELIRDLFKIVVLRTSRASGLSGRTFLRSAAKAFRILRTEGLAGLRRKLKSEIEVNYEYADWVATYDTLTDADRDEIRRHIAQLSYKPMISLIMPVYNTSERWLRLAIESAQRQLYPDWELCIADDASFDPVVKEILQEYASKDSRIKVAFRHDNGHISAASNTAIEIATGEFIAFLDHDDELSEHALYMVAVELNTFRDTDLIYSDEDKIDEKGRRYNPYFKPDWNPALFSAQNFICHLAVYRARIVRELGGLRVGYEGAQDWDLAMRVTEEIPAARIRHIPHLLYHWRAIEGSTAVSDEQKRYARAAQQQTLISHFERIGKKVKVLPVADHYWRIKYSLPESPPKVTLIIPTRNGFALLWRCVESIYTKTTYRNFELIIVDNQSDDPKLLEYLAQLESERKVRVLRYDAPFNYAAINNLAVQSASGDIIGLLNNDLEVIAPDWLDEMVSYAVQPEIGAVGAMLYYPNDTIQHAGVVLGIGFPPPGVAGHAYKNFRRGYHGQGSRALLCQNLSGVTAACLVVRRQVFEEVGGLDENNLPIAFNDVDFCLRLAEKHYRNVWTPYAELYHHESASRGYEDTPEKRDRFDAESRYMKRRWQELLVNDPAYNLNLALGREPFMLSFPPRATKPWRSSETRQTQVISTAPSHQTRPFGINLAGYFESEKGVGEAARATVRALEAVSVPYVMNNVHDAGAVNVDSISGGFSDENPYNINLVHINADQLPTFGVRKGREYFAQRFNVGYWFWELASFPSDYYGSFECFDELWTASKFTQAALAHASPIPVVRIPPALNPAPMMVDKETGCDRFGLPCDRFLFLVMFDFHSSIERKNPVAAVEAFKQAFGKAEDVMLVVKSSHLSNDKAPLRSILESAQNQNNIRVIDGVFSRWEIDHLLVACDCFVSLHRSEGFGLPIAEAMKFRKPVLATAYSGNMDFTTPTNSFLVRYGLVELDRDYGPYRLGSVWAEPDVSHAADLMRYVYEKREEAAKIGAKAEQDIMRLFSPPVIGQQIRERLTRLASLGRFSVDKHN